MKNLDMKYLLLVFVMAACSPQNNVKETVLETKENKTEKVTMQKEGLEIATLGGGCFWCVEAVFQRLEGVEKVESGYSGGRIKNPTYREICSGLTGHAEVVQVHFDPSKISYEDIVYVFFRTHDPTTLNRQGNDKGTQYRSVIYYHNDTQKEIAQRVLEETDAAKVWDDPIVTEVSPLDIFYPAENYHQDYYDQNRSQGYCVYVIDPKVKKLEKEFGDKMKESYKN